MKINDDILKTIYTAAIIIMSVIITSVIINKYDSNDNIETNINTEYEQVDTISNLIKVNGEFIDEDDYNQLDWQEYTPIPDSMN